MAVYTTVMDVEHEWNRTVTDADSAHVVRQIDKAERMVIRAIPGLAARITAGTTTIADVRFVVASMVVRVLRNPDGKQAETAGDYSYQLSTAATRSTMYLSAEEKAILRGPALPNTVQLDDAALERPLRRPYPLDLYRDRWGFTGDWP